MAENILACISGTSFLPILDLCRNIANNINFHSAQIQWKLMTKFFYKLKKPNFQIFPNFWSKKVFSKNSGSTMHNIIRVNINMPKFSEIEWSNSKKTPRQTTGKKAGQTLFHRILPANTRGLTSTAAVDWHLKVKDIEYNVGLTKIYCITVSMQKISSIYTLILNIQQIFGSGELNKWLCPFLTTCTKKSVK